MLDVEQRVTGTDLGVLLYGDGVHHAGQVGLDLDRGVLNDVTLDRDRVGDAAFGHGDGLDVGGVARGDVSGRPVALRGEESDLHQSDGDDHRNEGFEGGPDEALHGVLHGRRRDQNRVGAPGS